MSTSQQEADELGEAAAWLDELFVPPGEALCTDSFLDSLPVEWTGSEDVGPFGAGQLFNVASDLGDAWHIDAHRGDFSPPPSTSCLPTISRDINMAAEDTSAAEKLADASNPALALTATDVSNALTSKIGPRFSREAVLALRYWLSTHKEHPYPNGGEMEMLQRQTSLSKTQIANWFANARRRGTMNLQSRLSQSYIEQDSTKPIAIPQRPATPTVGGRSRNLNPLERWFDSPPEDEPASVTAIARAMGSEQPGMCLPPSAWNRLPCNERCTYMP
jgi:hypothetical protein